MQPPAYLLRPCLATRVDLLAAGAASASKPRVRLATESTRPYTLSATCSPDPCW